MSLWPRHRVRRPKNWQPKISLWVRMWRCEGAVFLSEHHAAPWQTLPAPAAITQANKNTLTEKSQSAFPSILLCVLLCIQQCVFKVVFPERFKALDCTVWKTSSIFGCKYDVIYSIDENTGIYNLFLLPSLLATRGNMVFFLWGWEGVGWGGDVNVPWTCTHGRCYAILWMGCGGGDGNVPVSWCKRSNFFRSTQVQSSGFSRHII